MGSGDVLLLAAAGFLAGGTNAISAGGSLIAFPAYLAAGYPPLAANVTNSLAQWPGYASSVLGYRAELTGQRRRVALLSAVSALGAVAGCVLLLVTPVAAFDAVVPPLVLVASLLLAAQPRIAGWIGLAGRPGSDRLRVLVPVMLVAGAYGGYFGGALGVILIATLSLTVHDSLLRLNAVKVALSLVIGTVTLVSFALFGPVNWVGVALVGPGTLAGGYAGARVARRLSERVLRWSVVALGVTVAMLLVLRD